MSYGWELVANKNVNFLKVFCGFQHNSNNCINAFELKNRNHHLLLKTTQLPGNRSLDYKLRRVNLQTYK